MQDHSVKKLFKEELERYAHKDQYKSSPLTPLILAWIKKRKTNKKLEICEFGGGAGQLLSEIQNSYPNYRYTNVEIINDYKQYLASNKINFVLGSVLHSNFPEAAFDIIIMRDVLHHLVGASYKETLSNQRLALSELKRLLRWGGVISIEEFINESDIAGRLIYFITKLNSKIGIHIPHLFISSNVIVSFLTTNKLISLCNDVFGKNNVKAEIVHQKKIWYTSLLYLFGRLNKAILTINKGLEV